MVNAGLNPSPKEPSTATEPFGTSTVKQISHSYFFKAQVKPLRKKRKYCKVNTKNI